VSRGLPVPKDLRAQKASKVPLEYRARRASKDHRVRRDLKERGGNKAVRVRQVPAVKQAPRVKPQQ